jgi:hypothetical protein
MRLHPILIVCLLAPEAFAQKPCPGSDCDVAEANRPVEWLLRIHKTLLEGLRVPTSAFTFHLNIGRKVIQLSESDLTEGSPCARGPLTS